MLNVFLLSFTFDNDLGILYLYQSLVLILSRINRSGLAIAFDAEPN